MMNIIMKLSGMNVMMAEDVNTPVLRCGQCGEAVRTVPERKKTDSLWNENFERMFAGR